MTAKILQLSAFLLAVLGVARLQAQGPPFQTDDPVPVDLHHYEFYIFGAADATAVGTNVTGPAFEFNWGAVPRLQLHAVLPWGLAGPSNNATFIPNGPGPTKFGLTDAELGAKVAFIKESKYIPQIGTFPMLELPTGSADNGLGVGKTWYKVPIWVQKNIGKWLLDGGGGYTVVPQTGYRNFPYGGFLLKYAFGERLELGSEVFSHGAVSDDAPQTRGSTMIGAGGYYHFHDPNKQLLFSYGHSAAGLAESYAYVGMYWTWGKDQSPAAASGGFLGPYGNGRGAQR